MPILNNMAHQHALSSTYAPKNPNSGTVTADDIDSVFFVLYFILLFIIYLVESIFLSSSPK